MSAARQPRGIPVGGQFAATSHAPSTVTLVGSTVLKTNPQNRFARVESVEQLDMEYDYATSPENLSHDGERPLSHQRSAAASMRREYTERRLELSEAEVAQGHELKAGLNLTTLEVGEPRTLPASVHRLPGIEDITLTNVAEPNGRKHVKIAYTVAGGEDIVSLSRPEWESQRAATEGSLKAALEDQFDVRTESGPNGLPADSVELINDKIVVVQYESFRATPVNGLPADKSIDVGDLTDWASTISNEMADPRVFSKVEDTFQEKLRYWDSDE